MVLNGALEIGEIEIAECAGDDVRCELIIVADADDAEPAFAALHLIEAEGAEAGERVLRRGVGRPDAVAIARVDIDAGPVGRGGALTGISAAIAVPLKLPSSMPSTTMTIRAFTGAFPIAKSRPLNRAITQD